MSTQTLQFGDSHNAKEIITVRMRSKHLSFFNLEFGFYFTIYNHYDNEIQTGPNMRRASFSVFHAFVV